MKHALHRFGRILLPLALTAIMTLASAGLAAAAGSARQSPTPAQCPLFIGYVCLAEPTGALRLVPEGQSRTFPGGLPVVEISNATNSLYCVGASPFNFYVEPGEVVSMETTVRSLAPSDGACLT